MSEYYERSSIMMQISIQILTAIMKYIQKTAIIFHPNLTDSILEDTVLVRQL